MLKIYIMSALLLSILGLSVGIPHCPVWKEIKPCECWMDTKLIMITCNRTSSFDEVVRTLRGHFTPSDRVSLKIIYSSVEDLNFRNFKELNMTIENLKLNNNKLRELESDSFEGLTEVNFLSLADNRLGKVPEHLWRRLPHVATLDLGRTMIKELTSTSFKALPAVCIVLAGNQITRMDTDTFPKELERLHIGRNNIRTLNGTLTNLSNLMWLFANSNDLIDIEGELPLEAKKLKMLHFSNNRLIRLPQQLKNYPALDSIFFQYNKIKSLDGALSKSRKLLRAVLDDNEIEILTKEDFVETENLESLFLANNDIRSLNGSLLSLRNLNFLNIAHNKLTEFSFQDIMGLQQLRTIDMSYNRIKTLIGPAANLVELNYKLTELKLDHNEIESLDGALSGLPELLRLNISFNKLTRISPDDLIGLDQLRLLDISHNYLTTLEETSKTFLPRLEELRASHNFLTILEKDFHGLPVLCHADLSHNQIVALGRELVSKTRCKIGHEVHEGTWDTLKIELQGNPILCDAALPEIVSAMEINHTKISGEPHCAPPSEQSITNRPNDYFGLNPETTPVLPAAISANLPNIQPSESIQIKSIYQTSAYEAAAHKTNSNNLEYRIENTNSNETVQHQADDNRLNVTNINVADAPVIDPIKQEKQLSKLASEIEELRTRFEELATQNQILLNQQLPTKSTDKPPNEDEARKP